MNFHFKTWRLKKKGKEKKKVREDAYKHPKYIDLVRYRFWPRNKQTKQQTNKQTNTNKQTKNKTEFKFKPEYSHACKHVKKIWELPFPGNCTIWRETFTFEIKIYIGNGGKSLQNEEYNYSLGEKYWLHSQKVMQAFCLLCLIVFQHYTCVTTLPYKVKR